MKILFYIEKTILKLVRFIAYSIFGVYFLGLALGLRKIIEYKLTIVELLGIILVIYLIPKKKDRFGYRTNDPVFEKYKDLTDAIYYKTYSPGRSIPRILLMLINLCVLFYVLRIFYTLIPGLKF